MVEQLAPFGQVGTRLDAPHLGQGRIGRSADRFGIGLERLQTQ
jgi:hypothetical protein